MAEIVRVSTVLLLLLLASCGLLDDGHDAECRELEYERRARSLQGDAEALRAEELRLMPEPSIAHAPAFVGADGTDAFGYPLRQPDKRALLLLLRLRRFDDLERWMTYFQDQFAVDHRKEHWPDAALSAFFNPDPRLAPLLDEWVDAYPESFAAKAARGNFRYALAMQARGGQSAAETSVVQSLGMVLELVPAATDMGQALELRPDFIAAHSRLISMLVSFEGQSLSVMTRVLLDDATAKCPGCYEARSAYLYSLSPKWSGSRVAMEAYAAGLGPWFEQNPRLRVLLGHVDHDRCEVLLDRQRYEQALITCHATLAHGEAPEYLKSEATALIFLGRFSEALPLLDRALELSPQDRSALLTRGTALASLDLRAAARDLLLLRELGSNRDLNELVESTAFQLAKQGRARMERREPEQAAIDLDLAMELLPDHGGLRDLRARNDARLGLDALLARAKANPDDLRLHIRADYALASARRLTDVLELWDGFIARHPSVARAYLERSGTHALLGDQRSALEDVARACDLGSELGCLDLEQRRAGCGRFGVPEADDGLPRSLLPLSLVPLSLMLLLLRRRRLGRRTIARVSIVLVMGLLPIACRPAPDEPEVLDAVAGVVLPLDASPPGTRLRAEARHELKMGAPGPAFHLTASLVTETEVFASTPDRTTAAKIRVLHRRVAVRAGEAPPEERPSLTVGHTYVVSRAEGEALRAFDVDAGPLTDEELEEVRTVESLEAGILREVLGGRELIIGQHVRYPADIEKKTYDGKGEGVTRHRNIDLVLTDVSRGIAHIEASMTIDSERPNGTSSTCQMSGWYEVSLDGSGSSSIHHEGPCEMRTRSGGSGRGEQRIDVKAVPLTRPDRSSRPVKD